MDCGKGNVAAYLIQYVDFLSMAYQCFHEISMSSVDRRVQWGLTILQNNMSEDETSNAEPGQALRGIIAGQGFTASTNIVSIEDATQSENVLAHN